MRCLCEIYRSSKVAELYVYVPQGADLNLLPEPVLTRLGKPSRVMELELTPERRLVRADVNKVMALLEEQGFYVQMPPGEMRDERCET